ncbi:MAG: tRNA 2-thiocytidine(32) synthetase TtcA [Defluviitaleaceae bacterium]|nr:tRNA 2-thiocytidine(32) synthetase TtcA [Defluviitaleaceae bacterium]
MDTKRLLSYIRKATMDYDMIQEGDRIGVGISGGKDSLSLLLGLKAMQRFYPVKYEVEAITVSLGLPNFDLSGVQKMCDDIGVRYTVVETDIGEIIFDIRKESNPCALCSKMRKGALNNEAKKLGCNKIALGHNKDDVIQTLFLSLFYEGRIHTFAPVTYLDKTELYSIRPIMYAPEAEIVKFVQRENLPVVKSPCPVDGYTKREKIKEFIEEQSKEYPDLVEKVFGAIKRSNIRGWEKGID